MNSNGEPAATEPVSASAVGTPATASPAERQGPASRSLRDFDYFASRPVPVPNPGEDASTIYRNQEERRLEARRRVRRQLGQTLLSLLAVVAWASLMWGHRYWFVYALRPERPPLVLGSVTTLRPNEIGHNAHVSLEGITGHRGIGQRGTRGLSFARRDWWFVELLGSQGVFIQVPEDPARFGAFTQVTVSGRAVDPAREPCCNAVFDVYQQEFGPLDGANLRVIQVDTHPGEGRAPYVVALLVWSVLIASFIMTTRRMFFSMRAMLYARSEGGLAGR